MRLERTFKTNYLFLRIIAVVARSSTPITVEQIGAALNMRAAVIAQCIALHLYLERNQAAQLEFPLPADYWVPRAHDVITREMLEPKKAGKMASVERAIRAALASIGQTVH